MKKLHLSNTDKKLAGVCGGIAEYLGIDSTLVRLITVVIALVTHILPALVLYVLAAIIIPRAPKHHSEPHTEHNHHHPGTQA